MDGTTVRKDDVRTVFAAMVFAQVYARETAFLNEKQNERRGRKVRKIQMITQAKLHRNAM